MTTTNTIGRVRQSLASQIDRLDSILDGLAEAINETVVAAVQAAVGQAVREAVQATLAKRPPRGGQVGEGDQGFWPAG